MFRPEGPPRVDLCARSRSALTRGAPTPSRSDGGSSPPPTKGDRVAMAKYIAQKLLATIPVMLVVSAGVFLLLQLIPGDPVAAMLGENSTPEAYANLKHELGLDLPLPVQYARWL